MLFRRSRIANPTYTTIGFPPRLNTMDDNLLGPEEDFRPPENFPLMAAIFEGGLVVVALGLGWLLGVDPLATFPRDWVGVGWGAAWGLAATLPPLAVLWLCMKYPVRPFRELFEVVDTLLVPLFRTCRVADMAVISVLAGLSEEMLFRGVVQALAAGWVEGPLGVWLGLAVAAVLFGLAHRITTTYAVLASVIGLYLGGIWLISGNLLVPIVAHAAYDFLVLVYLVKLRKPPVTSP